MMRPSRSDGAIFLVCLMALLSSCVLTPNPSILVTTESAQGMMEAMAETPKQPERPVIVVGGYRDPGLGSWWVKRKLARVLAPESLTSVTFFFSMSFDACCEKLIAAVDRDFPTDDPNWTTPVDVVAASMGGVVARYAAMERGDHRRLRIRRLFTISTPHRGASLADELPALDPMHHQLRTGSKFIQRLNDEMANLAYEIIPYVRLSDRIVGARNAAPPGQSPLWVSARLFQPSHHFAPSDARILADIMSRLRSEPSLFAEPHAPLPKDE